MKIINKHEKKDCPSYQRCKELLLSKLFKSYCNCFPNLENKLKSIRRLLNNKNIVKSGQIVYLTNDNYLVPETRHLAILCPPNYVGTYIVDEKKSFRKSVSETMFTTERIPVEKINKVLITTDKLVVQSFNDDSYFNRNYINFIESLYPNCQYKVANINQQKVLVAVHEGIEVAYVAMVVKEELGNYVKVEED